MPDTQYCSGGSRGFSQPAAALGFACAAACFGRDHDCARLSQGMGRVSSSHGVRGLARPSWMDGVSFRGDGILWRDRDCAGIVHAFFSLAVVIEMGVAIWKVHFKSGLTGNGGYEFPLALATIAFALLCFGGGPWGFNFGKGSGGLRRAGKG